MTRSKLTVVKVDCCAREVEEDVTAHRRLARFGLEHRAALLLTVPQLVNEIAKNLRATRLRAVRALEHITDMHTHVCERGVRHACVREEYQACVCASQ